MTVFRYPLQPVVPDRRGNIENPGTVATDYLMIHRHRLNYEDGKAGNNFYSRKTPGNRQKVDYNKDVVYIAMPPNIQTSYGPSYKRMDIGVSGVTATQLLDSGSDMSDLVKKLEGAAKAALPEFGTSAALQLVNGFNQFLGLQGQLDLNTINQLREGRIFNPFSEQIFQGMSFRTHNFAFKFFIRNRREASHVYRIIRYLKQGALPDIEGGEFSEKLINKNDEFDFPKQKGEDVERDEENVFKTDYFENFQDGYANDDRYFKVPDRFDLRFTRVRTDNNRSPKRLLKGKYNNPEDVDKDRKDLHFKMYPSVCTGIQVNYTPDNQYLARKRPETDSVDVPAVVVSASFTETRLLTKRDAKVGY